MKDRLSAIVYTSPIPTAIGGLDGSIIAFNEALESLIGYKSSEIRDVTDWVNKLYPDNEYRDFVWKNIKQALDGKKQDCTEFTITCKNGSKKITDFHTSFFKDGLVIQMIDITESKRAEQELREERDKAQKYLDVAGTMFVLLDRKGKVELVNKKGCELLGYQEAEILHHDWFDSFLPERTRDVVREVFCRLMAGKIKPVEYYENPILTRNGQERIIAWHNTVMKDDSGNVIGTLSSGQDITERKKAEEALRESEERFRTLFESAPDAIYITDLEGRFIDGNNVAEELCGYQRDQLIGKNFVETGMLSTEQLPKALASLKKNVDGQSTGPDEFVLKKKDGSFVTLEIRTFPVKINEEMLVLGVGRDITERKKAEEALIEKEVTIRAIIETSRDWIWAIDLDGIHTYVNPAVERILGYLPEELIGRWSLNLMHEEDRKKIVKKLPQWKKQKSGWNSLVIKWRHKDGGYRYLESSAVPILDAQGNLRGFRGVDRDITERKEAEKRNLDYQERLKSLASKLSLSEEQERRRIAAYLHDNISQALALGRIEIESLSKSVGSVDKKVIEDLSGKIKTIIENVQSLTFDLSSPTLYKFGLEKAVDELLDDLFGKTEINYKLSHGKSPIQLDNTLSVLLFRCIRELLVNIIKHARANRVRVAIRRNGDNIQITINDDGIGFDFDQNELSVGRTGGFGLFNIQERINFIGGNFNVQSQQGKGCRLTLRVPVKTEMDWSKEKSDAG
ncbi:MAG: PAS domain-containing sensor histidine kinase [Planctomycetota bacterium]